MIRTLEQHFCIDYQYNIYFTDRLFTLGNNVFREFLSQHSSPMFKQKILFVLDGGMLVKHPKLFDQIRNYFIDIDDVKLIDEPLVLPGGEICKNDAKNLEQIIEAVDQYGIDRHSYIAAIGGGALLDLAGFAAAIAHRGIKHIRIPTTVLSQNDSGVGVKNGVNYTDKKNFLGTFAPPVAVFNDTAFLQTLDDRSWVSGIAEAIKVALIKDLPFFHWIQQHAESLKKKPSTQMDELIFRCAELHLEHIRNGDPFELGSSRPLDFGHWSAHKLEQMTGFELLHGEAVSIGLSMDVLYSCYLGNISQAEALTVINLFLELGLPVYHSILDKAEAQGILLAGLLDFQEHLGGKLTIVLLETLGAGKDYHHMDHVLICKAINFLKAYAKEKGVTHEVC